MLEVFLTMRQLHELLWYLSEALTLQAAYPLYNAISSVLHETESLTQLDPDLLLNLNPRPIITRLVVLPPLLQTILSDAWLSHPIASHVRVAHSIR
jgi:hypothetical protein